MNVKEGGIVNALKNEECVVLPLVLKKQWYDMVASGEKREEYRVSKMVMRQIERWFGEAWINNKRLVVQFFLAYQKDRPSMAFVAGTPFTSTQSMHPEWGEPTCFHYVIPLAEKVELYERATC